jgi:hypothetical protein
MKNFNNELGVMCANMLCMAVEDDACGVVDGFSKPNADIMKEIKAEEEARVRDEQKNAAKNQLQLDSYRQEKEAIELRFDRAIAEAKADKLKARTKENNAYTEGGVDTEVHKQNLEKIERAYDEACEKAQREKNKAMNNLRTKNPRGYDRDRWS